MIFTRFICCCAAVLNILWKIKFTACAPATDAVQPLELHQARIDTDADAYERIVLWIARPYLDRLSTPRTSLTRALIPACRATPTCCACPVPFGAPRAAQWTACATCAARKDYGSDLLAQGALVELMIGLNRAADSHGDLRPAGTSDQVVDAVLHYINEHYSESLTLAPIG